MLARDSGGAGLGWLGEYDMDRDEVCAIGGALDHRCGVSACRERRQFCRM